MGDAEGRHDDGVDAGLCVVELCFCFVSIALLPKSSSATPDATLPAPWVPLSFLFGEPRLYFSPEDRYWPNVGLALDAVYATSGRSSSSDYFTARNRDVVPPESNDEGIRGAGSAGSVAYCRWWHIRSWKWSWKWSGREKQTRKLIVGVE